MYDVIIVDDETFELEALTKLKIWEKNSLNVAKTFTDANLALDYIKNNKVDVIVSDIAMPKMSGVEFLTKVRSEKGMKVVFIFISAYTDFAYTHEAIVNNVFDYILKPIDIVELEKLCERVYRHLLSTGIDDEPNIKSMQCQQVLIDYLEETKSKNSVENVFLHNGITFSFEKSKMFLLRITIDDFEQILENWHYSIERFYFAIDNILNENSVFSFVSLKMKGNKIRYLCILNEELSNSELVKKLNELFDVLKIVIKYKVEYHLLSDVESFHNLREQIYKYISIPKSENAVKPTIDEAIKFMEENHMRDISLLDVAEHLNLSTYHVSRLFKKQTGESFVNYLNTFRINEVKSLLITTNMTQSNIALKTGFGTAQKLYRTFQRIVGCSPSEYRNRFLN